jgi:hypothetical protein
LKRGAVVIVSKTNVFGTLLDIGDFSAIPSLTELAMSLLITEVLSSRHFGESLGTPIRKMGEINLGLKS